MPRCTCPGERQFCTTRLQSASFLSSPSVAADARLRARAGLPFPCIDSRPGHVGWNPSPPVPWADVPEGPGSAGGTTTSVCSARAHPADSAQGNVMWCEDGHQGCETGYKHPTASATWGQGWGQGVQSRETLPHQAASLCSTLLCACPVPAPTPRII